jgi:hypothetical protein
MKLKSLLSVVLLSAATLSNGYNVRSTVVTPQASAITVPGGASNSGRMEARDGWAGAHDRGTRGTSSGSTVYPVTIGGDNHARKFSMSYSNRAGERWSNTFGNNPGDTHFVIDGYVYLPNPSQVMNLELDINAVSSSGRTYILSTQCAGATGHWEYGYTTGTQGHWGSTGVACNPRNWAPNKWHHIRIAIHRDSGGYGTHEAVSLDGDYHSFGNITKTCTKDLGWQNGTLNFQFQIEGSSTSHGSASAYMHQWVIYHW